MFINLNIKYCTEQILMVCVYNVTYFCLYSLDIRATLILIKQER